MNDNGILEHVPGPCVARAQEALPAATTAEDHDYPVDIDAAHLSRVRIFFHKQKTKRGKFSHWFWLAVRAERV